MAAFRLDFNNLREEPRIDAEDFENFTFRALGVNPFTLEGVICDKSNSGLGFFCKPIPYLNLGMRLDLWGMMIYEVRYAQCWSQQVMKVGLRLLKEID